MDKYDITDYLKDDKELQKAVIEEFLKEIAELKAYKDVNEDFKTAWEELKAENERLKKEIRNNKSAYQVELGTYNMECGNLLEENKQLLQTLQEIKTIAEKLMADNLCNNCDGIGLDANCQDTGCPYYQMDAILQKITKAEEE